jgi:hypothetical protein
MAKEKLHAVELGERMEREMLCVVWAWKAHAVAVMQAFFQILAQLSDQRVSYFPGLYHFQSRSLGWFHASMPPIFLWYKLP